MKGKMKKLNKEMNFSKLIKQPMTTRSDLEFLAKKLDLEPIRIVWLKEADPNYKGFRIINLGNPTISGTHWCSTYDGKYFDSFGLVPPEKLDHLEWIPLQIQNQDYGGCGSYALLWLWYAKEGELDQFYNHFTILN
jgi:hypothetical protein